MEEEEKLRNVGVEGDRDKRDFLKLSEALMCLCPAESKEIENLSVVPGGLQRDTCRRNKQMTERWRRVRLKELGGRFDIDVKIKTKTDEGIS